MHETHSSSPIDVAKMEKLVTDEDFETLRVYMSTANARETDPSTWKDETLDGCLDASIRGGTVVDLFHVLDEHLPPEVFMSLVRRRIDDLKDTLGGFTDDDGNLWFEEDHAGAFFPTCWNLFKRYYRTCHESDQGDDVYAPREPDFKWSVGN